MRTEKRGRHAHWADQIADLLADRAEADQLGDDVDEVLRKVDLERPFRNDGVKELGEAYAHMRCELSEHFDFDVSAEDGRAKFSAMTAKAAADDFFRIRIRTALRDLGVITDANDDTYVVLVLKALLG